VIFYPIIDSCIFIYMQAAKECPTTMKM